MLDNLLTNLVLGFNTFTVICYLIIGYLYHTLIIYKTIRGTSVFKIKDKESFIGSFWAFLFFWPVMLIIAIVVKGGKLPRVNPIYKKFREEFYDENEE